MPKIKPNSKCPCGSGKKFKKCCKNQATVDAIESWRKKRGKNPKECIGFESTLSFYPSRRSVNISIPSMFQCITKTLFLSDGLQQHTNLARRLGETGYSLSKES
jgi:hypothetical protein